jgi:hypothetical protein
MKFSQRFLPPTNCVIGENISATAPSSRKGEVDGVGERGLRSLQKNYKMGHGE